MTRAASLTPVAMLAALAAGCFEDPHRPGDPAQLVPAAEGSAAVDDWIRAEHYQAWACQEIREPAGPSVHGRVRVCANALAATHGAGEFPVGAATVKELYDATDVLVGVTLAAHTRAGATSDTWFWFERRGDEITADGWFGARVEACVMCHEAAGRDAAHPGHDFVYTAP